jgi:putative chitinase
MEDVAGMSHESDIFCHAVLLARVLENHKMTPQDLARATGARIERATEYLPVIEAAMAEFDINTPSRQAAFLAQIGHESGGLRYTTEIWGPTPAQVRYEGRKDLGNVRPGDGARFKGRGLIQTTGRDNYNATGRALGVDLISQPELLAAPELAARSAAWYWQSRGLNALADAGDFRRITLRINGGTNGQAERVALHAKALEVLA